MKITALLTGLTLIALPAVSAATCTRADLTGTWRIYTVLESSVGRCTLIMPSTGTTISTSSSCYLPEVVNSAPLRGSISMSTDCHLTGKVTIGLKQRLIDAWISKGKDSLSGIGWQSGDVYNTSSVFSGVKQ